MKVYVVEYDLTLPKTTEHRRESYIDIIKFIDTVKRLQGKWWISNIKVYSGEVKEFNIEKVSNPF
ncbi:TPA: hypothetical protein N2D99_002387 [Clostridium botulinum]|nr:hypothetical protein [Clostridium botulinum]